MKKCRSKNIHDCFQITKETVDQVLLDHRGYIKYIPIKYITNNFMDENPFGEREQLTCSGASIEIGHWIVIQEIMNGGGHTILNYMSYDDEYFHKNFELVT